MIADVGDGVGHWEHCENAATPMLMTPSLILTPVKCLQPSNELAPMFVTLLGIM